MMLAVQSAPSPPGPGSYKAAVERPTGSGGWMSTPPTISACAWALERARARQRESFIIGLLFRNASPARPMATKPRILAITRKEIGRSASNRDREDKD